MKFKFSADLSDLPLSVTMTTTLENWDVIRQNVKKAFPELSHAIERAENECYQLFQEQGE